MTGSNRINRLSESQTLSLTKEVRKLRSAGKDVIGLTLGEPDFDTPAHIRNAAIEAINQGKTHYPPVSGIPELREAIAAKCRRENKIPYKAENIVVSTGAKQSLVNAIMSLMNPGDEAILIAPYWVSYFEMLKMADAHIVIVGTDAASGFKASAEKIEAAITPRTKMIFYNSPSNPAGSMYNAEEVRQIVGVLERNRHVMLISDEIYEHIIYNFPHVSPASFEQVYEQVITVNGVSKAFAMTGWRIGYMGAPKWIAELCDKWQGQITSGANSIAQWATLTALTGELYPTYAMRDQFRERRDYLYQRLLSIEGLKTPCPDGAFYFYPDLSAFFGRVSPAGNKIKDIDDLTRYLLSDALVAVIPGSAFGTKEHVRISYAYTLEVLKQAADRIGQGLLALK